MGKNLDIRKQLMIRYISLVVVFCIVFFVSCMTIGRSVLIENSRILLSNFAKETGENISKIIDLEKSNAEIIADAPILSDSTVDMGSKMKYLRRIVKSQGYKKAALIDLEGNCLTINNESVNVSELEYFNRSLHGESFLTAPYFSKADGGLQIAITAPIIKSGKVQQILFLSKDAEKFSEITNGISFGKTGTAYVVNGEGTNIINRDINKVINRVNRIEDAKVDSDYKELAEITKRMITGENATGSYMFEGARKFLGYAPIPSQGWAVGVTVELSDMLSGVKKLERSVILASIVMLICMIIVTFRISSGLSTRLAKLQEEVSQMAKGDFTPNKKNHHIMDEISKIDNELQMTKLSVAEMVNRLQMSSDKMKGQYSRLSDVSQKSTDDLGKKADEN